MLAAWSGLGYYRRAHLLHSAARIVVPPERAADRQPGGQVLGQLVGGCHPVLGGSGVAPPPAPPTALFIGAASRAMTATM